LCYADPFLVSFQEKKYLFAEKFDFLTKKGSIVSVAIDKDTIEPDMETALDWPFHISYPCLVEVGPQLFCVPEILDMNEIAIYRCEKFPRIWNKVSVVSEGQRYADPTLFQHEGTWWVFATRYDEYSEGNASLYAWYATDLKGPWKPHLRNPIKCDISSSRSAGNIIHREGKLYRPTQDCSRKYGESVVLNRIYKLTPNDFEETFESRMMATKEYPNACHHLSNVDGVTVIDGRKDHFSLRAGVNRLSHFLSQPSKKPRLLRQNAKSGKINLEVIKQTHDPFHVI
jgi:hypothetical protein